jgi:glutathione S-transferase
MTQSIRSEYVIHGIPRSLFTRKLQAAIAFYGLPHRIEPRGTGADDPLGQRAGTHQIPVLETPENWVLADTTPILQLLDARVPSRRLFPEGPLGVLVHIVEEVLDEWVARVMVHYRWHYAKNTAYVLEQFTGKKFSEEEAQEHPVAQWGPRACRATGTEFLAQQEAAEAEYLGLMEALQTQLSCTAFALGDRPTAVDCILLGGLHAHTNADPIPDLSPYPKVLAWAEGGATDAAGSESEGALAAFPESTAFAQHVLRIGREEYVPFVEANAEALDAGAKAFEIKTYGETTSYLTRPYPEQSRRLIQSRIRDQLTDPERSEVSAWLEEVGLACFLP